MACRPLFSTLDSFDQRAQCRSTAFSAPGIGPPQPVRCAGWQDQVHGRECHQDACGAGRLQNPHLGGLPEHQGLQVRPTTSLSRSPQRQALEAAGQPPTMGAAPTSCAMPSGAAAAVSRTHPGIMPGCCTRALVQSPRLQPQRLTWRLCRDAICSLILGSPPGKVYSKLRSTCARLNDS